MYKLVIFDMDGTLADTSPGIINSHRYAHKMMGRLVPDKEILSSVIGGPLLQTYIERFGFSPEQAVEAVSIYRQYYSEQGIYEASLYPGVKEALEILQSKGIRLALATLKAERFAKKMLENMDVLQYFSVVYGMDEADTRTKSQLIEMCMRSVGVSSKNTVMIGDSIHDLSGAEACGVAFVGVTYGFGFSPDDAYEIPVVHSADEIVSTVTEGKPMFERQ